MDFNLGDIIAYQGVFFPFFEDSECPFAVFLQFLGTHPVGKCSVRVVPADLVVLLEERGEGFLFLIKDFRNGIREAFLYSVHVGDNA